MIDQAVLDQIALSRDEYRCIVERLGRAPSDVELGMFGAMWSEHCGYKNSRALLRLLPIQGPHVLQGPGENAGAVDVGDGLAIVFKMESHNHPSAVEPYQGAATGVGGIIRDIFTMGARPIALLDSLRFGPLDRPRNRYLFGGVVAGIAGYGNSIGVPTVGGEVLFAPRYSGNPLVNVMAVGLMRHEELIRSAATGVGNPLLLVGADTGRDGIHGCSGLASRELSESTEEQRPTVQVGNPFLEKLLIEACLEARLSGHVVSMQDLGAAGITSAVVEAASKGNSGVDVDVARVPRRESGMDAYDVMLSESQERMLVVVCRGYEDEVRAIFDRWGLHSSVIGQVTDDGLVRVRDHGRIVAEVPAETLAQAPVYRRPGIRPAWLDELRRLDWRCLPASPSHNADLLALLAFPDIASKEYVFRQYDWSVQTNTVVGPGAADAAVLRLKGTSRGIAVATDCNGRYCNLDPYLGAALAVAEATRNVSCVGARPLALTDCLNFGNPEKPEIFYQLEAAITGLRDACLALDTPVVSGNVSLYNETNGEAIYPTPIVGVVGLLDDLARRTTLAFQGDGDAIILLGDDRGASLGGSAWLEARHGLIGGALPALDLDREARVQALCREAIAAGLVQSAHDCGDGGLAVCLAECCIAGEIGAALTPALSQEERGLLPLPLGEGGGEGSAGGEGRPGEGQGERGSPARGEALEGVTEVTRWLFNEAPSRIVVTTPPTQADRLLALAEVQRVPATRLGTVGGEALRIGEWVDVPVEKLDRAWRALGSSG